MHRVGVGQVRARQVFALLFTVLPAAFSGSVKPDTNLTIVLDFKGPHSPQSVEAMKEETQGILKDAGLHLRWKSRQEAQIASFDELVVVSFSGACELPPAPLYDELGPLASTYETDGHIQPFSEVSCDRVSAFVRSGLHGGDVLRGELLLGKALGRVLAHELVHMLTGDKEHSRAGVFKAGLTVEQLLAGELSLSPGDIQRLRSRP